MDTYPSIIYHDWCLCTAQGISRIIQCRYYYTMKRIKRLISLSNNYVVNTFDIYINGKKVCDYEEETITVCDLLIFDRQIYRVEIRRLPGLEVIKK